MVTEGDAGTRHALFGVFLNDPSGKPVTFSVDTEPVTALPGEDYEALSISDVTIAPGETGTQILVWVTGRPGQEPDETFRCRLHSNGNATLARPAGLCTIQELRFLSINRDGNDIVLTFPSGEFEKYHVLRSTSLDGPSSAVVWAPLTPVRGLEGTGSPLSFRDVNAAATGEQSFYRIRSEDAPPIIFVP